METEDLKEIFDNYLAGRATPDELKLLLNHFHMEKEGGLLTELVVNEMAKSEITDDTTLAQRQPVFSRVYANLQMRIEAEQKVVKPLWRRPLYRVAAAVFIFFLGGLAVIHYRSAQPEMIAVNAPMGQVKQVILPDSSKVWLNAGSQLQYARNFVNGKTRTVYLTGQGFFDVVHQAQHPFIVHTQNVTITVLGTSFEVKAFDKEKETKITVSTGKVGITLTGTEPALFLLPGQQVVVSRASKHLIKNEALNDIAAWRENRLVFDNEPLDNVFHALERKYNVHIEVLTPTLLNEVTSMKLDNQPLSDVMTTLSFSKHFHYELANDSTIVIK